MKLRVRVLGLDAAGKTIAIINDEDARDLGVHPLERIVLKKGKKKLTVIINTTTRFVKEGEIVVYKEVQDLLGLKNRDIVSVEPREHLLSKEYIRKKVNGNELYYKEMKTIVTDLLEHDLNDLEISSFITALHIHGLSINESMAMSRAMIETSKRIKFPGTVVDKHSIGGVGGDKTSILLVPIIASTGLVIPKTSSRSITSPAGTADRMEVLAPVELNVNEIKRVVHRTGGCLVWGGSVDLAPADDLFIQIEHPLSMDPLMLPSVMSKKKAVGAKYVVIDIPTGLEAKVKTNKEAEILARKFITLGKRLNINVSCGITRGHQPIGYAMGPALEAREALEILMLKKETKDLIEKVSSLAGILLRKTKKGNADTARRILQSGKAEKKLREIIDAQGGDKNIKPDDIPIANHKVSIKSPFTGMIAGISDDSIVSVARTAGAPKDKTSGVLLNKKVEDYVKKGEILYTIYADKRQKLNRALRLARHCNIFTIFDRHRKNMLIEKCS